MVLVTNPSKLDKALKMLQDGTLGISKDTTSLEKRLEKIESKLDKLNVNQSKTENSIGDVADKLDRTLPEDKEDLQYDDKDW